jgi:hypothetical protein
VLLRVNVWQQLQDELPEVRRNTIYVRGNLLQFSNRVGVKFVLLLFFRVMRIATSGLDWSRIQAE